MSDERGRGKAEDAELADASYHLDTGWTLRLLVTWRGLVLVVSPPDGDAVRVTLGPKAGAWLRDCLARWLESGRLEE